MKKHEILDMLFELGEGIQQMQENGESDLRGILHRIDEMGRKVMSSGEDSSQRSFSQLDKIQCMRNLNGYKVGDIVMSEEVDTFGMVGEVLDVPLGHPSEYICGGNYNVKGIGILLGDKMNLLTPVEWRDGR